MPREAVDTDRAPKAIGPYSQAVKASGTTVWLSGQIPLAPGSMDLVRDPREQVHQVLRNLAAVAEAAGGSFADVVKLNIYLTDLGHFGTVNEVMAEYFEEPFPARAVIGVASLPRGALVEIEGIMSLGG